MARVEDVAQRIADNTILQAAARVMMAFGVPITILVGSWIVKDLVAIDRRVAVIEESRPEMTRRVAALELQNQRDSDEAARIAGRLGAIEAGIGETQRGILRIERIIDSRRP